MPVTAHHVGIIILNWNNAPDTLACLTSLGQLNCSDYQAIVVDNGSTDDSVLAIKAQFPRVSLLETGDNLGYAEGNNAGIRYALDSGVNYVCILNNDVIVDADFLDEAVSVAENDPLVGIVGVTVYSADRPNAMVANGGWIDWTAGSTNLLRGDSRDTDRPGNTLPREVDFVVGCAILVKRQLLDTIGLLDPRYYLNFEDVEWCARAARHGYRTVLAPTAKVWHRVSGTLGQASPAKTYYMTRNGLLFFWTYAPRIWRVLALVRIILRTCRTIGAWTLKARYHTETFRRRRTANLLALRDFFLGRFGRMGTDVVQVCYGSDQG